MNQTNNQYASLNNILWRKFSLARNVMRWVDTYYGVGFGGDRGESLQEGVAGEWRGHHWYTLQDNSSHWNKNTGLLTLSWIVYDHIKSDREEWNDLRDIWFVEKERSHLAGSGGLQSQSPHTISLNQSLSHSHPAPTHTPRVNPQSQDQLNCQVSFKYM